MRNEKFIKEVKETVQYIKDTGCTRVVDFSLFSIHSRMTIEHSNGDEYVIEGDEYDKGPKRVGGIGSTDGQNRKELAESIKEATTEVKGVDSTVVETTVPITEADHIKNEDNPQEESKETDSQKNDKENNKEIQNDNNNQSKKMKRKH